MDGYIIESLGLRLNKSILTISQTLILFVVCYMYNVYVFFFITVRLRWATICLYSCPVHVSFLFDISDHLAIYGRFQSCSCRIYNSERHRPTKLLWDKADIGLYRAVLCALLLLPEYSSTSVC